MLNYFIEQADNEGQTSEPPAWVSKKNVSYSAWECVENLKKVKIDYIKNHHRLSDYTIKRNYQINGSEIASILEINRSSLMNTSTFSNNFRKYLDGINSELNRIKEDKIKKIKLKPSRGSIRSNKDELVNINASLRKEVESLKSQKTEELVRRTFDQLPLPIKKKLGIE